MLFLERLEERSLLTAATPAVTLSDADQLMIELINRARADPAAEAARYGIDLNAGLPAGTISTMAKPALAPEQSLIDMSEFHTQWMLDNDTFSHDGPLGETLSNRADNYGYSYTVIGENLAWVGGGGAADPLATAVTALQENLFRSVEHRKNMLRPDFVEVGVGVRTGPFRSDGVVYNATLVTVDFGSRGGSHYFTGVAYANPVVGDPFFAIGQGLNLVTVSAAAVDDSVTYTTTTGTSGGYALPVPPGTYNLLAQGGTLTNSIAHQQVTLGASDVKVDFIAGGVASPEAMDDVAMCVQGQSVVLAVLANDTAEGALNPQLVQLVDAPHHGAATANLITGEVSYVPEVSYVGLDSFTYRVSDLQGNLSQLAQVQVAVIDPAQHPWENPLLPCDVNGDGSVTPLDALFLINQINTHGSGTLPTPSPNGSFPLPYLDVNGDGILTALDVLLVVNRLNGTTSGEGEYMSFSASVQGLPPSVTSSAPASGTPLDRDAFSLRPWTATQDGHATPSLDGADGVWADQEPWLTDIAAHVTQARWK
ncbi:MAG: dockerin type I domain-containing protein [Planctomycetota bacterium]|nr:dockerin type I domain-containing protein [Planctomycetota bacterium]